MPYRPKNERKRGRIRSFADLWRALEHRREWVDGRLYQLRPAMNQGEPILIIDELRDESENKETPGAGGQS
jgi:hypothetical protein